MSSRLNAVLVNVLMIAVTVVIGLAGFEYACRKFVDDGMQYHIEMWKYAVQLKQPSGDPAVGHEHRPNASARLMGADVTINGTGQRGPEVGPKRPGVTRIAMVGDSVTFGWGVPQALTFSSVVQRILNERGHPAETINLGVGNINTSMEVAALINRIDQLDPDLIVVNYFINDAEPTPVAEGTPGWIARHLTMYPVLGGAWDGLKRRVLGAPEWQDYYRDLYKPGAPGLAATVAAVERLGEVCHRRPVSCVVVNIPELRELAPYPFGEVNDYVKILAASQSMNYLDVLPALAKERPSDLWVTVPDPHPNARAHQLIGEAVAGWLIDTGVVRPATTPAP